MLSSYFISGTHLHLQALAMLLGPMFASQLAIRTSLRASQFICGIALIVTLTPFIFYVLPQTHNVPKLATARLRPQVMVTMLIKNEFKSDFLYEYVMTGCTSHLRR